MRIKSLSTCALLSAALMAASPAFAQEKLTVWWVKGFYKAEDDALFAAINAALSSAQVDNDLILMGMCLQLTVAACAMNRRTPLGPIV